MFSPEISVLIGVGALVVLSYAFIYPRIAGSDGAVMVKLDCLLSAIALLAVWFIYGTHGQRFQVMDFETNWFVFTLGTHFVVEVPFAVWYYKKHNVLASYKRRNKLRSKR